MCFREYSWPPPRLVYELIWWMSLCFAQPCACSSRVHLKLSKMRHFFLVQLFFLFIDFVRSTAMLILSWLFDGKCKSGRWAMVRQYSGNEWAQNEWLWCGWVVVSFLVEGRLAELIEWVRLRACFVSIYKPIIATRTLTMIVMIILFQQRHYLQQQQQWQQTRGRWSRSQHVHGQTGP